MNISLQQLAAALGGEISGNQILAPGPNHGPKDRSLSVRLSDSAPDGFVVHSFAGDDPLACKDHVRQVGGLARWEPQKSGNSAGSAISRMADRQRFSSQVATKTERSIAKAGSPPAEYIYRLADGSPYLRVKRPGFFQAHWNGSGWANGAPKGPKIPYRLPEMIEASSNGVMDVVVVEGEKDADNLAALGFIATTNSCGAEKFTPDLAEWFKDRNVYVLPDNDEPGERHATQIVETLRPVAKSIRVVRLPGLPEKGDVSDWIEAGGTAGELADLLKAAPMDEAAAGYTIEATPYVWKQPEQIPVRDWLYGYQLIRKFVSGTISPGGVGKSSLIAAEALAMVSGKNLLGITPKQRLRVWLWNLEDPTEETERKIQAAAMHYRLTPEDIGDRLFMDSGRNQPLVVATTGRNGAVIMRPVIDALIEETKRRGIDVLKIDPFVSCHNVLENDNSAMDMIVKEWGKVADACKCAVHLVHHTPKMSGNEVTAESARGGKAFADACRVIRAINRMTPDEGGKAGVDNHRLYFRTLNDKGSMQPPADSSDWFKLVSVSLGNGPLGGPGDNVGVVTKWEWPDPLAGITGADFDKAAAVIRSDRWRENSQAKMWVGRAIARALELDPENKADKAKITGLIKIWRASGALIAVEGQDENREKKMFIEVANDG